MVECDSQEAGVLHMIFALLVVMYFAATWLIFILPSRYADKCLAGVRQPVGLYIEEQPEACIVYAEVVSSFEAAPTQTAAVAGSFAMFASHLCVALPELEGDRRLSFHRGSGADLRAGGFRRHELSLAIDVTGMPTDMQSECIKLARKLTNVTMDSNMNVRTKMFFAQARNVGSFAIVGNLAHLSKYSSHWHHYDVYGKLYSAILAYSITVSDSRVRMALGALTVLTALVITLSSPAASETVSRAMTVSHASLLLLYVLMFATHVRLHWLSNDDADKTNEVLWFCARVSFVIPAVYNLYCARSTFTGNAKQTSRDVWLDLFIGRAAYFMTPEHMKAVYEPLAAVDCLVAAPGREVRDVVQPVWEPRPCEGSWMAWAARRIFCCRQEAQRPAVYELNALDMQTARLETDDRVIVLNDFRDLVEVRTVSGCGPKQGWVPRSVLRPSTAQRDLQSDEVELSGIFSEPGSAASERHLGREALFGG
eukprot:TRINITY_DN33959_c0_g1_i1.p1 TRINITY_DN33959_c0_g1~~TRINITY_DN33959_c0_g1_i1.p1  ORF type:complete len:481 (+),score=57.61 TRINITY_DN33959_c0_g1_i1:581-2023(+)